MSLTASLKPSVPKRKGIFPGYSLVAAGGIICLWGYAVWMYGFGQYVKPLIAHFGWSRAQVSLAFSFGRFEGGLEGPFGGIAIDKWGPRAVNFCGMLLLGGGLCAMYFVNSLWMFYVVWILTSTGANLGLADALDAATANWFVRRRGLMISLMKSVIGLSAPVLALSTWLLYQFGWRQAFLILGVGTLLTAVPLSWFFVKPKRPEYYGWLPDGKRVGEEIAADTEAAINAGVEYAAETTGEVEFTVRQALRGRVWWLCVLGFALRGMVSPAVNVHTIPLLTDRGVDPMVAAAAMGTMLVMTIPARLLFGWLGDNVPIRRIRYLVMLAHFIEAVGIFILIRATSMAWVWVYLIIYGFGFGAGIAIGPPLRGRYWGRKAYATIQGIMAPFTMITGIFAPVYTGWIYDTTGNYISAFQVLLICLLVSVAVMYFASPPKPPEKIGKITEVV